MPPILTAFADGEKCPPAMLGKKPAPGKKPALVPGFFRKSGTGAGNQGRELVFVPVRKTSITRFVIRHFVLSRRFIVTRASGPCMGAWQRKTP
jgi:hypothetical protein